MSTRELSILVTAKNLAAGALRGVRGDLKGINAEAARGVKAAGANIARIASFAAIGAVTVIGKSISMASDLNETVSKVGVVFGSSAQTVLDFGKTSASALGMSQNAALTAAGVYGNLFRAMGLTEGVSADMSTKLVGLAADLASFNNMDPTEVTDKLRAGLSGETEPLRSLGVNINDAILRQKAFDMGLVKSTKQVLPAAAKAQAAYALIFEQTVLAQGDFARTSGGLANQQRILKANLEDTATMIGQALLPKITELAQKINAFIVDHKADFESFGATLPGIFDKLVQFVGNLPWDAIGDAFQLMGDGAKAAMDMFLGAPPWLQTAIITGWGLNKLTGGALGNIVGTLGSGLIKGVLGMNAGVVNINAGVVNGGGVGGGAAGGKVPWALAGGAAAVALSGTLFSQGSEMNQSTAAQAISNRAHQPGATMANVFGPGTGGTLGALAEFARNPQMRAGVSPQLLREIDKVASQIDSSLRPLPVIASQFERSRATSEQLYSLQQREAARLQSILAPLPGSIRAMVDKEWTTSLTVNTVVNYNARLAQAAITRTLISSGKIRAMGF